MKFASFFVALLVGALSDSAAAAPGEDVADIGIPAINAPAPLYPSCDLFRSGHTSKSGKSMSMSKSGKSMSMSKSSEANSSGTGTLQVTYRNGTTYYLQVNNVNPTYCVGELKTLVVDTFNALYDISISNEQNDLFVDGSELPNDVTLLQYGLFSAGVFAELDLQIKDGVAISSEGGLSGGSDQIQDVPVRS